MEWLRCVRLPQIENGPQPYREVAHFFALHHPERVLRVLRCAKSAVRLVHLRRPILEVARSYYCTGDIPGQHWRQQLGWPFSSHNMIHLTPAAEQDLSDEALCLWVWLETEAVATLLAQNLWPTRFFAIHQLDDLQAVNDLFEWLGCPTLVRLPKVDRNSKQHTWSREPPTVGTWKRGVAELRAACSPATLPVLEQTLLQADVL